MENIQPVFRKNSPASENTRSIYNECRDKKPYYAVEQTL